MLLVDLDYRCEDKSFGEKWVMVQNKLNVCNDVIHVDHSFCPSASCSLLLLSITFMSITRIAHHFHGHHSYCPSFSWQSLSLFITPLSIIRKLITGMPITHLSMTRMSTTLMSITRDNICYSYELQKATLFGMQ